MHVSKSTRAAVGGAILGALFVFHFANDAGAQSLETQADAVRACQGAVQDKARSMWGVTKDIAFEQPVVAYEKVRFTLDGKGRLAADAAQDDLSYHCVYDSDRSAVTDVVLNRIEAGNQ